ncbi:DUF1622 domain-containing protein [Ruegeria sp. SCP11]|uniref:DUF1622 domain-containing protein n=1 Tax=Ruegeria sp. SCP11 TaxID=3141378 RepID=UPI00333D72E7
MLSLFEPDDGSVHAIAPGLDAILKWIAISIELMAIFILVIGTIRFFSGFVRAELNGQLDVRGAHLDTRRVEYGRYILSGLEVFIVADIIHSALSLALNDLIFLAILVAIRIAVSYFTRIEVWHVQQTKDDLEDDGKTVRRSNKNISPT